MKEPIIEMTINEFLKKTKDLLSLIDSKYGDFYTPKYEEDSEENECSRCHGFTQVEEGGEIIDCGNCNGTGESTDVVFDAIGFSEFIEHGIMFTDTTFYDLINCNIKTK